MSSQTQDSNEDKSKTDDSNSNAFFDIYGPEVYLQQTFFSPKQFLLLVLFIFFQLVYACTVESSFSFRQLKVFVFIFILYFGYKARICTLGGVGVAGRGLCIGLLV